MNIFTHGLETERLRLIPVAEHHIPDIFKEFTEEVARYTFPQPSLDISNTENFVHDSIQKMKEKEDILLIWESKEKGDFIGCFWLSHINTRIPEPWLWIKKSARGKGLWREGLLALIQRGKENLTFDHMTYPADQENQPSRKIAELAGGKIEIDDQGNEIIIEMPTANQKKILNTVKYKIFNH